MTSTRMAVGAAVISCVSAAMMTGALPIAHDHLNLRYQDDGIMRSLSICLSFHARLFA
jgi:hypothetical protein